LSLKDLGVNELPHEITNTSTRERKEEEEPSQPTHIAKTFKDYIDEREEAKILNTPNFNWRDLQKLYRNIPRGM
jgi:hypothetical protein